MIDTSSPFFDFIICNANADIAALRLSGSKKNYSFDFSFALEQIEARQRTKSKLPTICAHNRFLFPTRLSSEQASSEVTAKYKQPLLLGNSLCDLTGGLGIDTYHFSLVAKQVCYIEQSELFCEVAKHNFKTLGQSNIEVICDDCCEFISKTTLSFDTIYIDPARRDTQNKRTFALSDCTPNILSIMPYISTHCERLIVKISPMLDISQTLRELPQTREIHVIAVRNECKELLFVVHPSAAASSPTVFTHNSNASGEEALQFCWIEEQNRVLLSYAKKIKHYLYEPNAAVLKAGAFKTVAHQYGIEKLHPNSHLYTHNTYIEEFAGRCFEVIECINFNSKDIKKLHLSYPSANLTARNFPLKADALRARLSIKEGGDIYIFATTLYPQQKILVVCKKQ